MKTEWQPSMKNFKVTSAFLSDNKTFTFFDKYAAAWKFYAAKYFLASKTLENGFWEII